MGKRICFPDSLHKNSTATLSTAPPPHGDVEVGVTIKGISKGPVGWNVCCLDCISGSTPAVNSVLWFLKMLPLPLGETGYTAHGSIALSFLKTAYKPKIICKQRLIRKKGKKKNTPLATNKTTVCGQQILFSVSKWDHIYYVNLKPTFFTCHTGTPLAGQWLGLCVSNVGDMGSIPDWGNKILHATWPTFF